MPFGSPPCHTARESRPPKRQACKAEIASLPSPPPLPILSFLRASENCLFPPLLLLLLFPLPPFGLCYFIAGWGKGGQIAKRGKSGAHIFSLSSLLSFLCPTRSRLHTPGNGKWDAKRHFPISHSDCTSQSGPIFHCVRYNMLEESNVVGGNWNTENLATLQTLEFPPLF